MKLHLYFARKFALSLAGVFGIFAILLILLDIVEQLRRFSDSGISFGTAFELSLLSVPQTLYRILPLIVLLATLVLFLGLARSSELVVTRAAGRSALRALISPVVVALLLGALLNLPDVGAGVGVGLVGGVVVGVAVEVADGVA